MASSNAYLIGKQKKILKIKIEYINQFDGKKSLQTTISTIVLMLCSCNNNN